MGVGYSMDRIQCKVRLAAAEVRSFWFFVPASSYKLGSFDPGCQREIWARIILIWIVFSECFRLLHKYFFKTPESLNSGETTLGVGKRNQPLELSSNLREVWQCPFSLPSYRFFSTRQRPSPGTVKTSRRFVDNSTSHRQQPVWPWPSDT